MDSALQKKLASWLSIAVIVGYWLNDLCIKDHSAAVLPTDLMKIFLMVLKTKIMLLAVMYALLRLEGHDFAQLGFRSPRILPQLLTGIAFGAGTWAFIHVLVNPLIGALNPHPSIEGTDMLIYLKDLKNVLLWIPFVIFSGGIAEEFERIFILTRFENWLGKYGLYTALLISSVIFGMGHLYQGVNAAIGIGVGGLMYGFVYLRKRSAVEAVTCHAFFNVISIIAGYLLNNA